MSKLISAATSLGYNFAVGTATVCALTGIYLFRRLAQGPVCKSRAVLTGKTAIVTGANTGMGKQTALDFARRNARVIVACRNEENGRKAVRDIIKQTNNSNVVFRKVDLASFDSIQNFTDQVIQEEQCVDILVNNAGVFMLPLRRSVDGIEMHFAVNYLGHFLLTTQLLKHLKQASCARIVNVAADIPTWINGINFEDINSENSYNRVMAVIQSKQAMLLFTKYLASTLEGANVTVNSVHPGIVRNEFGRYRDYWYGYFQVSHWLYITILPYSGNFGEIFYLAIWQIGFKITKNHQFKLNMCVL